MPERPLQYLCGPKCAWEYADKRAKEASRKDWNIKKRAMQEKLKTLSDYEKLARIVFQKWIRKRDEGLPCISCGITSSDQWHASHYFPAGVYSGLIFDDRNCAKACNKCNTYLHGNIANYRIGLVIRNGEAFVLELENDAPKLKDYKYSKEELINISKKYKLMLAK